RDEEDPLLKRDLYWVDIKGNQSTQHASTSLMNIQEAEAITQFIIWLSQNIQREIDVAVITPYSAQKQEIRKLLNQTQNPDGNTFYIEKLKVKVDTIDAFQGSEATIVCYSTVRSHGNLKFLLDKKRLNVACSRAQQHLVF